MMVQYQFNVKSIGVFMIVKEEVKKFLIEGLTLQEIANKFQVSRQRIAQIKDEICKNLKKSEYGAGKRAKIKREQKQKEFIEKYKRENWRLSDLEIVQHLKFQRKKQHCAKTGIEFSIDFHDIFWPTHCPILGLEIDYFADYRKEDSASFDRINNSLGYIKGNVRIISWRANRIKNDGTAEEHRKIADYIDNYNVNSF